MRLFPTYFRRFFMTERSSALGANVSSPLRTSAILTTEGSELEVRMDSLKRDYVTQRKISSHHMKDDARPSGSLCSLQARHEKTLHTSKHYGKLQEEMQITACVAAGSLL